MNKRIWRNRFIAGFVVGVLLVLGGWYFLRPVRDSDEITFDPVAAGNRIEEKAPFVDVLHIGLSDKSFFHPMSLVFHVGVEFHPAKNPYSVELTNTGWRILGEGEYTWEPGQEEDVYTHWNLWTQEKSDYFSENAMFSPGRAERAKPAVADLKDWYTNKLSVDLLMAVFFEAMPYYDQWNVIEITYLGHVDTPQMALGVDNTGKPGYVSTFQLLIGVSEVMYKKRSDAPEGEGYWILEAVERGGFSMDEYRELREIKTINLYPGFTFMGPLPYNHGFNHPWQARMVKR